MAFGRVQYASSGEGKSHCLLHYSSYYGSDPTMQRVPIFVSYNLASVAGSFLECGEDLLKCECQTDVTEIIMSRMLTG